jgi:uncharacterized repeat protein (TIGR01451 family)
VTVTDVVPADLDVITNTVEVADDGEARDDDTDEDAVDAAPDLMISKTNADDSVQPGDVITYTVTITNTGDRDATGVVVTDTLPQLTSFGGGTSDWEPVTGSPGRYIYTIGTLAGTDARVLTLTVALTDAVPVDLDYITNTVEVADDGEAQDDDTDEDAVDAASELAISKTDALTTVVPGQTMTYTITITNTGDRDTTGVVVTDTLPESTTYHTGTAAWQPMASTNAYTYTIGDLGAGRTRTLTLTVRLTDTVPTGLEEITNTVEVSDDGLNGSPAAGEATDVNAVDAAPDLVISKTDGVTSVVPSQTVTYTLTITNVGTQDATGVAVTDTLPAGDYSDFVAASDSGIPWNGRILWLPFDLPAGDSVIRTVTLAVKDLDPWPVGVEVITNTAEVSDDGSNGADLNPEDNKGIDADGIDASPDLLIAKDDGEESAAPGDLLVYELSYLNKGSQNATGVVITETVPEHTTFNAGASTSGWQMVDASGVYTFSLGLVPVGSGGAVDFAVTVSDTLPAGVEIITNTAQIADDGSSGLDEMPADNSDADETILIAAPDLSVAKDDGLDSVEPGQVVTYTLTVENVGTQGATGVVVSDTLPGPTELITASHGGVESDGVVVWTGMELAAGDSFTRSLTVQVLPSIPARVDFITNTVSVADDGANGEDLTVEDNAAEDVDAVEAVPVLALLKMDGRASVKPGEVLTYTLLAKNVGEQAASDLVMSDTLPAHTTYITASQGGVESNGVVVWAGLEVDVGAQLERTVTVQVNQVIPPGVSTITNQAEIAGPEGVYDSAQDVDTLVPVPNLILTKEDGEDRVSAEQVVTYTLTIANGGTGEATGVLLSDTLPTATVFVAASDGGDETGPSSGVVTWPTFDLAAGASLTRTVTVQVLDAIPAGVEAITNTASVADDGTHGPDADLSNNSAEDVDLVDADPVLSIAKSDGRNTVGPGEVLAYTVTISNTGTQDVMGVVVTDTLPAHTEFVSASADYTFNLVDGVVVWEAFALGVDEVVIRTVTVQLDEALPDGVDAITNTVLAVEDGGLSAAADDVDTVISAPDLRVVKTDGRLGAQPGETLTYTLMVENVGTQAATGVVLSDTLPANTSFAGASDAGSEDGGVVTWPEFVLDAGTMVTRTVTVQMIGEWPTGATPILINTASVADDGANGADPVTENNTDIDITHVWLHHFYFPLISRH